MRLVQFDQQKIDLDRIDREVTDQDRQIYRDITSVEISEKQKDRIENPDRIHSRQQAVLAVHWHPEFVPMDTIMRRVDRMFPNRETELLIPTQHNVLLDLHGHSGVEVDCYSPEFDLKVQLLLHFDQERVKEAHTLRSMLAHTFRYRQGQLYEYIDTILDPSLEDRLTKAAADVGADEELVEFVQIHTKKLNQLIDEFYSSTPLESLRNKLLKYYFDALRPEYGDAIIDRVQVLLKAIKKIVKKYFSPEHFYHTNEIIEETRSLGGSIVIPHPEQFWPILLAGYDVDGYEVWNPQSREFTEFLIQVVNNHNESFKNRDRRLLVFMGDDCHMGEKVKEPEYQDAEKASREIGVQPPWDDLAIRKSLIVAGFSRDRVIQEYRERLAAG